MSVRGPMEIINKDEASPCEICQKNATKTPIIFYTEMIYVSFSTIHTAWQNQEKNLAFCVRSSYFFLFYAVFIEHQINTILDGKPNVGSCTEFAESKLPDYENFRFCLCCGKKENKLA